MNQTANTTEQAEAASGPQIVAIRKGAKGPGKQVVVVKTPEDAAEVKALLDTTVKGDETVIIRPLPETVILTAGEFKAKQAEAAEKEAARVSGLSKLTDEEKAAMGL